MKTAYAGSWNAEAFWRDDGLARLPALPDPAAEPIVAAMDELLFIACKPGDLLIVRSPLDASFADYLNQVGFAFDHNRKPFEPAQTPPANGNPRVSIFETLLEAPPSRVPELLNGTTRVDPYAVLPGTEAFCRKFSLPVDGPTLGNVIRVNSKVYSHQLAIELGLQKPGCVVESVADLLAQGRRLLDQGSLLIKDPFGVSGSGMLQVPTMSMLERIGSYLRTQEEDGKRVSLVLEPHLNTSLDFSCQLRIEPDGRVDFLSLQQSHNKHFAYQGSSRLDAEQHEAVERSGYFEQMQAIADRIYQDGYWGDVCVDSMQLQDAGIVPVLEINARKSMGLFNHLLDQSFREEQLDSYLGLLSVGVPAPFRFGEFLKKLDVAELLHTRDRRSGILPLSANTLLANLRPEDPPGRLRKGRFCFSILSRQEDHPAWGDKLRRFMQEAGFVLYN